MKNLSRGYDYPNDLLVIIEIPAKASAIKYEIDKESGLLFVDRFLRAPMFYPCNYGYVNQTLALDGDPSDVLVITPVAIQPASVIRARPIGMLRMEDEAGEDAKIIAVPHNSVSAEYSHIQDINGVPPLLLQQIECFFSHYKTLDRGKWAKVNGFAGVEEARAELQVSAERYENSKG